MFILITNVAYNNNFVIIIWLSAKQETNPYYSMHKNNGYERQWRRSPLLDIFVAFILLKFVVNTKT